MREPAQAGGAIHVGGFIQFLRDRHPASQQDDRPERHVLPDVGTDVAGQSHPVVIQVDRPVDAEQQVQHDCSACPTGRSQTSGSTYRQAVPVSPKAG